MNLRAAIRRFNTFGKGDPLSTGTCANPYQLSQNNTKRTPASVCETPSPQAYSVQSRAWEWSHVDEEKACLGMKPKESGETHFWWQSFELLNSGWVSLKLWAMWTNNSLFSSSSFGLVFLFITVRTLISQDPFLVQGLEISKLVMVKENGNSVRSEFIFWL